MIPNSVWNIHAQVVAATMPGTTHGISASERTNAAAAEFLVQQDAGQRAERDLQHDRAEHVVGGVPDRLRRHPRAGHGGVVLQADILALLDW